MRLLEYLFTLHLCCINAVLQNCPLPVRSRKEFLSPSLLTERVLVGFFFFLFFLLPPSPYLLLKPWRLLQMYTQGWQSRWMLSLAIKSSKHLVSVSCSLSLDLGSGPLSHPVPIDRTINILVSSSWFEPRYFLGALQNLSSCKDFKLLISALFCSHARAHMQILVI